MEPGAAGLFLTRPPVRHCQCSFTRGEKKRSSSEEEGETSWGPTTHTTTLRVWEAPAFEQASKRAIRALFISLQTRLKTKRLIGGVAVGFLRRRRRLAAVPEAPFCVPDAQHNHAQTVFPMSSLGRQTECTESRQ